MTSPTSTTHFQTTSFRVKDLDTLLMLPIVNRFVHEMKSAKCYQEPSGNLLSFGLPPQSFNCQFQDLGKNLDTDDIIKLMEAIEDHIHPDDTCHINYVKHHVGESLSFCTMVIRSGNTSGYCSACDAKNAFGDQNSKIIDGIT